MQRTEKIIWISFIWMYGIRIPGRQDKLQKKSILLDGDLLQSSVRKVSMTLHGSIGQLMQHTEEQAPKDSTVTSSVSSETIREILRFSIIQALAEQRTTRCLAEPASTDLKDGEETRTIQTTSIRHSIRTCRQNSCSTTMYLIG